MTAPARKQPTLKELRGICLKKQEAFDSRVFYRKLSLPITWLLVRTPVTPNAVTLAGALAGVAGLVFVGHPSSSFPLRILGLGLFEMAIILDHVDGEVARAKRLTSAGGAFLDNFVVEILLHLGLSLALPLSVFFQTQDPAWLTIGAAFFLLKSVSLATFYFRGYLSVSRPPTPLTTGQASGIRVRARLGSLFWEVRKVTNSAALFTLIDFALYVTPIGTLRVAGVQVTALGAYVVAGVFVLSASVALGAWHSSRGDFYVDMNPYK